MSEIKTEGIILKTIPYQEKKSIVTLLTKDHGIISLFVRQEKSFKGHSLINTFSHIDLVYQKIKTSECFALKEGTMIESHYFLRETWSRLEAAGKMSAAILFTQFPGKSSPLLYHLLLACFKQLPHFKSSLTLVTLFYLKLLTYEGVLSWEDGSLFPLPCSLKEWQLLKSISQTTLFSPYYQEMSLDVMCVKLEQWMKTEL
ncbi:MAG: DNA repair protein RecO [Candidatus Rhabdochlamydia sp.]